MCDKFCVNCKYMQGSKCKHERSHTTWKNPVSGKEHHYWWSCDSMRDVGGTCGTYGTLWEPTEPKETLKTRIIKWFKELR